MIPLNDYQKKLYKVLNDNITTAGIYDDVPINTKLPIVMLGDITISDGFTKCDCYKILQSILVYSEYEGKKEINQLVTEVITYVCQLFNQDINVDWCVIGVRLLDSTISRVEDIYEANLRFEFEIEK